jgi:hypothetical protein
MRYRPSLVYLFRIQNPAPALKRFGWFNSPAPAEETSLVPYWV